MSDVVVLRNQSVVTIVQGAPSAPIVTERPLQSVIIQREGIPGTPGQDGVDGAAGGTTYQHNQGSAATTWNISHNLGRFPSVTIVDSLGHEILGDVNFLSANLVSLSFGVPVSGTAYLN